MFIGILVGVILSVTEAGAWLDHYDDSKDLPRHRRHDSQYAAWIPGVAHMFGGDVHFIIHAVTVILRESSRTSRAVSS